MTGGRGRIVDGRFELLERLGSGGMGTVWRARDTALERDVALKEVHPDAVTLPRERVLREARALARLSHPNVVTIHHIVEADPHPWLVMELVPGQSLQDRLATGPIAPHEAARIGLDVLSGLRAAHAAGIHHRDVKPANVLLRPDGRAVLTDFGIAVLQGSTQLTNPGEVVGSPEYIAPERVRGAADEPAADLWSLGMTLYVAVEGVSPLRRPGTLATLAAVVEDPVPPPRRAGALGPVLRALLVKDPAARPTSAQLDGLLRQAAQAPRTAPAPAAGYTPTSLDSPRPTRPGPAPARRGSRPALVAVALVASLALVGGLVTALVMLAGERSDEGDSGASQSPSVTAPESPTPTPTQPTPSTTAPATSQSNGPTAGSWIAVLASVPVSGGTGARDARLRSIRQTVPEAQALLSDSYGSLRAGYWVVYAPGPFADGKDAVRFCADRGRTTATTCYGRYLSDARADYPLICYPQSGGSGRCVKP
ncbi:Serine/threonine-protein kinase PknD [Streptomyces sp. RB5]|uniref:non-specific serine/threonine protein kinase n=1 Tax=Streptomyces smaragdinus TaxID=2585196 RepID=A0A7K0CS96_9ACTN|nr:serine/threonine-protein kinase [Streptomyces smaragdinus]MQY16298.1 Serine/threonine-protein kinase PknD [Streptomyces smaragdinus]